MSPDHPSAAKKLIFTVTPGRSGTSYLAKLFEGVPGVGAHHEPSPNYAQVLRLVQSQPNVAYNYMTQYKLPVIENDPHPVYVETSHMTCKGFIEPLLRAGLHPFLIILRRPPREVAWSFQERNCVPCRSTYGIRDLLDPRDLGVLPFVGWEMASNYQLCFWYALEMERRQFFYADVARTLELPFVDVTHRELNDWACFSHILKTFDLPATDDVRRHHAAVSTAQHNKNDEYKAMGNDIGTEEEAVWNAIGHFQPALRTLIEKRYKQGNSSTQ